MYTPHLTYLSYHMRPYKYNIISVYPIPQILGILYTNVKVGFKTEK